MVLWIYGLIVFIVLEIKELLYNHLHYINYYNTNIIYILLKKKDFKGKKRPATNKFYIYLICKYLTKKIILLPIYDLFFQIPAKYQSKRLDFEFLGRYEIFENRPAHRSFPIAIHKSFRPFHSYIPAFLIILQGNYSIIETISCP